MNQRSPQVLTKFKDYTTEKYKRFLGFPINLAIDFSAIKDFSNIPLNNIGDPFSGRTSFLLESESIKFLGDFFQIEPSDLWGYVTSGGSESNIYAIYIAKQNLENPVIVTSTSSHYSFDKASMLFSIPLRQIDSNEDESTNLDDLRKQLLI